MASLVTLGDLKTRIRRQADMEFSAFIQDAELVAMINDSCQDLYDMLIQAGELYKITSTTINVVPGTDTYALPADFYKLLGVDWSIGNNDWVTMRKREFAERNNFSRTPSFFRTNGVLEYILFGDSLQFSPQPTSNATVRVYYAPAMTILVNDADTFDAINGWESYVIADCCIKALAKEESDVSAFVMMKQDAEAKIQKLKRNRDMAQASKVADVSFNYLNIYGIEF